MTLKIHLLQSAFHMEDILDWIDTQLHYMINHHIPLEEFIMYLKEYFIDF